MMLGVTRTGEQSISIVISSQALKDAERKRSIPDNFGQAELGLTTAGAVAMTKDGKPNTDIERFDNQFVLLYRELGGLTAEKPAGFTWEYYVPYSCQRLAGRDTVNFYS